MSYWKTLTTQFATEGWKWWNSQENINFYPLIHRKLFESTIKLSEVFLETSYGEYIIIRFYNTLNLNQQDKIQFHVKKPNSVNFSPYFDPNDPLIVKKFEFFVLKKMQTNPKILFNDPKFASNTSFFFGFSGLEIINQEKPYFLFVAIYSRLTIFLYWIDLTISANIVQIRIYFWSVFGHFSHSVSFKKMQACSPQLCTKMTCWSSCE